MQRDLEAFYLDVVQAIDAIMEFCSSLEEEDYLASKLVQAAVERKLEVIGEAMRRANVCFPGSIDTVPEAKAAIGLRNRLAHGYETIHQSTMWRNCSRRFACSAVHHDRPAGAKPCAC